MTEVKSDINNFIDSSFVPTNVFVIYYQYVRGYTVKSDITTFNLAVATDGTNSYAIVKYILCQKVDRIFRPTGVYYVDGTGTNQVLAYGNPDQCSSSNNGAPTGTYLFKLF